jgi:hypothetical protein
VIEPLGVLSTVVHPVGTVAVTGPSTATLTAVAQQAKLTAARRRVAESWSAYEAAADHAEHVEAECRATVDAVIADLEVTL